MVGISTHVESSRMEELTRGKRVGFRGLLGANSYLLISTATAIIGSFLYGTDQGVLSNPLTGENFGAKFPNSTQIPCSRAGSSLSCSLVLG
jgi:hypothetical protein